MTKGSNDKLLTSHYNFTLYQRGPDFPRLRNKIKKKEDEEEGSSGDYIHRQRVHKSVRFQRRTIFFFKKREQLLRLFRDFLCFRSWQSRGGSGHRKGEGHKVSDCSKTVLDVQLDCKRCLHGAWCSPTPGTVFPFPWQCTEGRILWPYASVPFIVGCFCLLPRRRQPPELTLLPFVRVSEEAGALLQLLSQEWNIGKAMPHILRKLGKFMALLWSFHYSTQPLPDYSTPAWQLGSLERGTLMHLMYIHDENTDCWQGQRKIMKCHN